MVTCPKCGHDLFVHKSFDPKFGIARHCGKQWYLREGVIVNAEYPKERKKKREEKKLG